MPVKIDKASIIKAAGTKEKIIREIFGRVNSDDTAISIAHMTSPEGWEEPGQRPEFDEYTYVLSGKLRVEIEGREFSVEAGQVFPDARQPLAFQFQGDHVGIREFLTELPGFAAGGGTGVENAAARRALQHLAGQLGGFVLDRQGALLKTGQLEYRPCRAQVDAPGGQFAGAGAVTQGGNGAGPLLLAAIDPQDFSMMPEGLVLALKVDELRDLVAYLRGSRQVALPEKPGKEQ